VTGGSLRKLLLKYRLYIVCSLTVLLAWEVITRSLVAYLADTTPDVAYWLRATPVVLLNLADDKLNADAATKAVESVLSSNIEQASQERSYAKGMQSIEKLDTPTETQANSEDETGTDSSSDTLSAADYDHVESWAEQALREDPLNARALRILAQVAEHSSDYTRTEALMHGAAQRSLQESLAIFWMMRENYRNKNYAEATRYADILLRTRPQLSEHVFPMLGRMAENVSASDELKQALAQNPPWRAQFFSALPRNVTDARTPLELLLSLRNTPTPPTDEERRSYLEALVQHKLYELAYYSWLQFLPPEQLSKTGRLFNASFDVAPSGLPFDWVFKKGAGVNIKFGTPSDQQGKRALLIEFGPGRVEFGSGLSELVLLPPGNYRLEGKYKTDLMSQRGLQWSVTCADATDPVGVSATMNGSDSSWKAIDLSFTVPPDECAAQYVTLTLDARSASEQFVSGAAWYDDLSITRVTDASPIPSEPALP
jgi:tetratricopeptide (TPR) repeat protein